jgi:hypothetical protein
MNTSSKPAASVGQILNSSLSSKKFIKLSKLLHRIHVEEILKEFNLPADTKPTEQLKSLESDSFSVVNLRAWLSKRSQP